MKKIFVLLYLYQFLLEFVAIYAIEKLLFLDSGLSIFQIALLNGVWGLSTLVFEIPTGILSDYWDRKKMLTASGLLLMIGYSLWIVFPSFWGFFFGLILRGLSLSFSSGTLQAYLYDGLLAQGKTDQFEKNWGRLKAMYYIGTGSGWIVGGIISEYSMTFVIVLSAVNGLLAALISLSLPSFPKQANPAETPLQFLKTGLLYSMKNHALLRVLLFSLIVWSSWFVLDEYWNVYLKWYGLSNHAFGIFIGLSSLCAGALGSLAHKAKHHLSSFIAGGVAALGLSLLLSGLLPSLWWLAPIFFLESILAGMLIIQDSLIQKHALPTHRATLASLQSLIKEFGILSGFVFAFVWQTSGIQVSYAFFGAIILCYLPFHFLLEKRDSRLPNSKLN